MEVTAGRVAWVDYAKGFCIVMVVMMHSTLGVEKATGAEGWMHYLVAFAKPFRMPDFFMISGLFLARVIDRDWRTYLDRKVVHFVYFYVLWLVIQFGLKTPGLIAENGVDATLRDFALAFIEPFGTMWFIYLLPIFFVVAKATRGLPWWGVWIVGALLQIAPIHTGWIVIDEFAERFVFFYSGYVFAAPIFRFATAAGAAPGMAGLGLLAWALLNGAMVFAGLADLPVVSLALGFAGAAAVIVFGALLARTRIASPLRYCGEHSIVIYLAFFLPMAASRAALLKTGIVTDVGTIALLVTASGVIGSLLIYWLLRGTPARILFERPAWAQLSPRRRVLQPAE
jgi:uncharacterized membrane protein YcfT